MWKTLQDTIFNARKTTKAKLTKHSRSKTEHEAPPVELGQLNRAQSGSETNLQKLHHEIDEYERRLALEKRSQRKALQELQLQLQRRDEELRETKAQLEQNTAVLDSRNDTIRGLREENREMVEDLMTTKRQVSRYKMVIGAEKDRSRYRDKACNALRKRIQELTERLSREENRRRLLFERLQELQGAIRVICRIRPDNSQDCLEYKIKNGNSYDDPAVLQIIEEKKTLWGEARPAIPETYEFERISGPRETNHDVFDEISNFVQSVIDGKKACVFCYGQSGTGKTYTMSNIDNLPGRLEGVNYKNDGIIPRVKTMLFKEKKRLEEIGFGMNIRGCCYEIYNNELWLLKLGGREKMSISKNTRAVKEPKLWTLSYGSDFDTMVEIGMNNRQFGTTKLNDNSSRSHFIINIETSVISRENPDVREGTLNLVDLAGSERTHQAGTTGAKLQEGNSINASLTQLGRIFISLSEGKVPTYNGNILTEFLQRSLEKGCMTLMLLMISLSKENWPATKHTLQFALDARSARKVGSLGRGTRTAPAGPKAGSK